LFWISGAKRQFLPTVGNAFLHFEAVRPQGNSIGEIPAALALRVLFNCRCCTPDFAMDLSLIFSIITAAS